jgi:hypothetical protein
MSLISVHLCMFVFVVQRVLDLLMTHHSSRRGLLDNFERFQLLVTPKREAQFQRLEGVRNVVISIIAGG